MTINTGRSSIKLKERVKKVGPLLSFSAKNGTERSERGSLGKWTGQGHLGVLPSGGLQFLEIFIIGR